MRLCEPTTRYYLWSLIAWTKVRHCLHWEKDLYQFEKVCKAAARKWAKRKKCCHCEYGTPWRED